MRPGRPGWAGHPGVIAALIVLPLVVAVGWLHRVHWYPVMDMAMTELRVRDVGIAHPPTIGLPGRIGTEAQPGSHPGPLSFYLLAGPYRLFGSTAFALQVATLTFHIAAVGLTLWLARRRGGPGVVLAVGLLLVLLLEGYGLRLLTEPWNPYLPVLWFVTFLVAAWSALDGDLVALPVAVFAGSVCAQTHVPYLGVTVAIGAVTVIGVLVFHRRGALRPVALAAVIGAVLWAPPIVQELRPGRGNLSILADHFGTPPMDPIGVGDGADFLLVHLDPWHIVVDQTADPGGYHDIFHARVPSRTRGLLALGAWAVAAGVAVWRRDRRLIALHTVVGAGLGAALLALSRIFGVPWYYLMLWAWGLGALMLLATVWTAIETARRGRELARPAVLIAGVVLIAALSARVMVRTRDTHMSTPDLTSQLAGVVPGTVDGLDGDRYLVRWYDAYFAGAQGYGLLNELEHQGYDVGVLGGDGPYVTFHRVIDPATAEGQVVLATGLWVERWAAVPGAEQLALVDPRTPEEQRKYDELHAAVVAALQEAGLDDLIAKLDYNVFGTGLDPRLSDFDAYLIGQLLEIGTPVAVYLAPIDASPTGPGT